MPESTRPLTPILDSSNCFTSFTLSYSSSLTLVAMTSLSLSLSLSLSSCCVLCFFFFLCDVCVKSSFYEEGPGGKTKVMAPDQPHNFQRWLRNYVVNCLAFTILKSYFFNFKVTLYNTSNIKNIIILSIYLNIIFMFFLYIFK